MELTEILDAIEAIEKNPANYVGGLQGLMDGKGLKVSMKKKLESLEKKRDAWFDAHPEWDEC